MQHRNRRVRKTNFRFNVVIDVWSLVCMRPQRINLFINWLLIGHKIIQSWIDDKCIWLWFAFRIWLECLIYERWTGKRRAPIEFEYFIELSNQCDIKLISISMNTISRTRTLKVKYIADTLHPSPRNQNSIVAFAMPALWIFDTMVL